MSSDSATEKRSAPYPGKCEPLSSCDVVFDGGTLLGKEDPQGITRLGEYRYRVSRSRFKATYLDDGLTDFMVPNQEDGLTTGMRLYLPPHRASDVRGTWQRLGFRHLDEVRSANGLSLGSAENAMRVRESLRDASELRVTVLRGGAEVVLNFELE